MRPSTLKRHSDAPGVGLGAAVYRGSAAFLAVYVAGSAISFGVHLLMARLLGAASYGNFVYAISWAPLLLLGCNFGLKPTTVRFVAAYNARGEWGSIRGFLRSSTFWTITASISVVALALVSLWLLRPRLDQLGTTLLLVATATPFVALGEVWSSATRGLGAVVRSQTPASIAQHTLLGITFLVLVATNGVEGGASLSAGAFLLATIGTLSVSGWLLRKELPREVSASRPRYDRRSWLRVAGSNLAIALFQAARTPLIVVIAGVYVNSQHLAYYGAAQRLANVMSLGLIGISAFASPLISKYYALSDLANLRRLTRVTARGALAAALATAILMIAFGIQLLRLFGPGFESGYVPLLILLLGEMTAAAAGPVGLFLTMTARETTATWIEGAACVLTVSLALVLIPHYGIVGAAIAVAGGSVVRNAAMIAAVQKQLRLRSAVA
jgi:O-antigen/teichoic acid export membrane protein